MLIEYQEIFEINTIVFTSPKILNTEKKVHYTRQATTLGGLHGCLWECQNLKHKWLIILLAYSFQWVCPILSKTLQHWPRLGTWGPRCIACQNLVEDDCGEDTMAAARWVGRGKTAASCVVQGRLGLWTLEESWMKYCGVGRMVYLVRQWGHGHLTKVSSGKRLLNGRSRDLEIQKCDIYTCHAASSWLDALSRCHRADSLKYLDQVSGTLLHKVAFCQ